LFISFFLFKDGKKLMNSVVGMIPLNKQYSNKLIEKFGRVTYSVVYAHIIVAIAQGALGTIGFYIFGIESAIFWGVIMAIFALLPLIGPAIIWIPASLFLLINGIINNSYFGMGMGIGLFLYGIFIISISDNLLRVKLIGGRSDVHPLTVLIGNDSLIYIAIPIPKTPKPAEKRIIVVIKFLIFFPSPDRFFIQVVKCSASCAATAIKPCKDFSINVLRSDLIVGFSSFFTITNTYLL